MTKTYLFRTFHFMPCYKTKQIPISVFCFEPYVQHMTKSLKSILLQQITRGSCTFKCCKSNELRNKLLLVFCFFPIVELCTLLSYISVWKHYLGKLVLHLWDSSVFPTVYKLRHFSKKIKRIFIFICFYFIFILKRLYEPMLRLL